MKYSGVEWIGDIPDDWEITKSKYVASTYTGNSIKDEVKNNYENKSDDTVPYIATKDIDGTSLKINYENLLYINKADKSFVRAHFGDTLMCVEGGSAGRKKTYLTENEVCFVNKLCCFHSFNINSKYLYYILSSPHYESEFKLNIIGLIGGVSRAKLDNFYIPFPDIITQQKIAEYLDKKCGQVDGLIANQQAQIEKLKQYKQSVITEAVTRGLNTSAPLKDSGIDWIGSIPENWELTKIKYVCNLNPAYKTNFNSTDIVSYAPMDCVKNGYLVHKETEYNTLTTGLTCFKENDIIMAKVTPCFENGNIAIATDLTNGYCYGSSELFVFNIKNINAKWLFYFLQNNIFKSYAISTMTGTGGLKRVSPAFVNNLTFAIPDEREQQQIADYLDNKCGEIDRLISLKQQKIEALLSYKKSLIYEYVTGKKEVV